MDQEQFIELYLNADAEIKEIISQILKEGLLPSELQDLPLNTICTNK